MGLCLCIFFCSAESATGQWESTPYHVAAPACSVICSHATVAIVGNPRCRADDSEQDEGCAEIYNFKVCFGDWLYNMTATMVEG